MEVKKSRSYRDLDVWNLSIDLVKEVYRLTNKFPASENFGLTNQIRRAAVSIPSNIAEGQGRNSAKEFRQFLAVGIGSVAELETQLIISQAIEYISQEELNPLLNTLDRIRKMIKSLAARVNR
ncbi:MAG: four helix bundle protein [Deltaproteobacteria bacterium]|nr:four helix bundle protein [Deltaproteobacteria bacterium]MBI4796884.1 four helix bundle protein [Deltaproteobacteria bacterium]